MARMRHERDVRGDHDVVALDLFAVHFHAERLLREFHGLRPLKDR